MEKLRALLKKIIPKGLFKRLSSPYHFFLGWLGRVLYKDPAQKIKVVGITGTKGKSSVVELTNAILIGGGFTTAVSGTVQMKLGDWCEPNKFKQTMPGRFFLQEFMAKAVKQNIDWMVIESTSEGAKQYRNRFINYDCLIFTNLAPEHIESHGGYENYKNAKLSIVRDSVQNGKKRPRTVVSNLDDKEGPDFLNFELENKIGYSLSELTDVIVKDRGLEFTYNKNRFVSPLTGKFNLYNLLAVIKFGESIGIPVEKMQKTLSEFGYIPGRVERIEEGQDFEVVVDYAHTPDSLENIYKAFDHAERRVCILGNTGGGRDQWKRPVMAKIADTYCDQIILTNEDPYDEDPLKILGEMRAAITQTEYEIIFDRRNAITEAINRAQKGDAILITGKGTDAFIMGPQGTKIPWSDSGICREVLKKKMGKN